MYVLSHKCNWHATITKTNSLLTCKKFITTKQTRKTQNNISQQAFKSFHHTLTRHEATISCRFEQQNYLRTTLTHQSPLYGSSTPRPHSLFHTTLSIHVQQFENLSFTHNVVSLPFDYLQFRTCLNGVHFA